MPQSTIGIETLNSLFGTTVVDNFTPDQKNYLCDSIRYIGGPEVALRVIDEIRTVFGDGQTDQLIVSNPIEFGDLMQSVAILQRNEGGLAACLDAAAGSLGVTTGELVDILIPHDLGSEFIGEMTGAGAEGFLDTLEGFVSVYGKEEVVETLEKSYEAFCNSLHTCSLQGGFSSLVDTLAEGLDRFQVVNVLQDLGVITLGRFMGDIDNFCEIVRNRVENRDDGRPLAIAIYPAEDWNGALSGARTVPAIIEAGYRVMYYVAETDSEAMTEMLEATQNGRNPAELLFIAGHGCQTSITLGSDSEPGQFDFSDYAELLGITKILADGGAVILGSCSTGQGLAEQANMVNMFAQVFPQANMVIGPVAEAWPPGIGFDEDGNVIEVCYLVDSYNGAHASGFTFSGMDRGILASKVEQTYQEIK